MAKDISAGFQCNQSRHDRNGFCRQPFVHHRSKPGDDGRRDKRIQHRNEYHHRPRFNDLVGFSEKELREMLTYYKEQGALPMSVDDAVTMMKPNYDNYCFSKNKLADCMFNSDMVLYCMKSLILHGVKPDEIVDPNIRTDFNKLAYLVRLDHGLGENFSVIKEDCGARRDSD